MTSNKIVLFTHMIFEANKISFTLIITSIIFQSSRISKTLTVNHNQVFKNHVARNPENLYSPPLSPNSLINISFHLYQRRVQITTNSIHYYAVEHHCPSTCHFVTAIKLVPYYVIIPNSLHALSHKTPITPPSLLACHLKLAFLSVSPP